MQVETAEDHSGVSRLKPRGNRAGRFPAVKGACIGRVPACTVYKVVRREVYSRPFTGREFFIIKITKAAAADFYNVNVNMTGGIYRVSKGRYESEFC